MKLIDKRSFSLYVLVGGISSFINYAIFSTLYGLIQLNYQIALTIGFFSGAIFNFTSNRQMTFRSHDHAAHKQFMKYCILLMGNYVANLLIAHWCVAHLKMTPYFAVIIAITSTVVFTYLLSKHWVFRMAEI